MKKTILTLCCLLLVGCGSKQERITKMHLSSEEEKAIEVFRSYKCKNPVELGIAVTKTKYPKILTALAIAESRGDINAVGDGGKAKGAFQVQEQHWSKVPETATEQAQQAERILEDLVASQPRRSHRWRHALAQYNGGTKPPEISYRRADRIIRMAKKMA